MMGQNQQNSFSDFFKSLRKMILHIFNFGFFQTFFYYRYLVVKTHSAVDFLKSILYLLSFQWLIFHCNCRGFVLNTLSTRKALQRSIYFQFFLLWKWVFQQSRKFRGEIFYSLFWSTTGAIWVLLIKINSTYETQSSRQKTMANKSAWNNLCIQPFVLLF